MGFAPCRESTKQLSTNWANAPVGSLTDLVSSARVWHWVERELWAQGILSSALEKWAHTVQCKSRDLQQSALETYIPQPAPLFSGRASSQITAGSCECPEPGKHSLVRLLLCACNCRSPSYSFSLHYRRQPWMTEGKSNHGWGNDAKWV